MKQFELFSKNEPMRPQIDIGDVFEAYYECRKNKRRTLNALQFELQFEKKLIRLWRDINSGHYKIGHSIAFMVKKPVLREIFAADFRDRVVHHLIIDKLNPLFEQVFNPHSYSCRKGKGTLFGVKDVASQMKACSENYTKDCYVLKMDIKSFFMSIDKDILCQKLYRFISENYHAPDRKIVLSLVKKVVYNQPENGCRIKGKISDWNGLPCEKSLFWSEKERGLAIGNLTSQIFANFYLTPLDNFIQQELGFEFYGRYVDDFVIFDKNPERLKKARLQIENFLKTKLGLTLHPKKVYLQHVSHGVRFIGAVILPYRIYIGKRTKHNLAAKIHALAPLMNTPQKIHDFCASINSYLGFMCHYSTFYLRQKMIGEVFKQKVGKMLLSPPSATKIVLKKPWRPQQLAQQMLRKIKHYANFLRWGNNGNVATTACLS